MRSYTCFVTSFVSCLFTVSLCAPISSSTNTTTALQFITLEEHYDSKSIRPYEIDPVYQLLIDALGTSTTPLLHTINGSRLDSMNDNGIRIQVVSNDPTPDALDMPGVVSQANDELANAIAPYPDRFRGFCFLPMAQPVAAADELERCISQLGFVGALVDSHLLNDTFYDSPNFDPLWATLERLEVPIYLHPTYPRIQEVNGTGGLYTPDNKVYSEPIASVLGTAGWGWHSDCGLQFLRLWLAGVFDRYPGLKVVLGHMGEMLPYMLARTDFVLGATKPAGATIPETYAKNIWVTTSGFFSLDPFSTLLRTTSVDRIMYSVDYPWATNEDGAKFMKALKTSGMVSEEEWEKIAFRNAENFLKLN